MTTTENKQNSIGSALQEAQAIIDVAEEKAKKIIDEAISSAREIKEAGYREGLRIGKDTAIKSSIKLIEEHEKVKEILEIEAAKLCTRILEHLFQLNAQDVINPIQEIAKKLIKDLPIGGNIYLVFNPINQEALSSVEKQLQEFCKTATLRFSPRHDCDGSTLVLKTDFGEIKVNLNDFVNEVIKQLKLPLNK